LGYLHRMLLSCIAACANLCIFLGYLIAIGILCSLSLTLPNHDASLLLSHRRDIPAGIAVGLLLGWWMLMSDVQIPYLECGELAKVKFLLAPPLLLLQRVQARQRMDQAKRDSDRKKDLLDTNVVTVSVNGEKVSDMSARQALSVVAAFTNGEERAAHELEEWKSGASGEYVEVHAGRLALGMFVGALLHALTRSILY